MQTRNVRQNGFHWRMRKNGMQIKKRTKMSTEEREIVGDKTRQSVFSLVTSSNDFVVVVIRQTQLSGDQMNRWQIVLIVLMTRRRDKKRRQKKYNMKIYFFISSKLFCNLLVSNFSSCTRNANFHCGKEC